jgi:hypothetical protein
MSWACTRQSISVLITYRVRYIFKTQTQRRFFLIQKHWDIADERIARYLAFCRHIVDLHLLYITRRLHTWERYLEQPTWSWSMPLSSPLHCTVHTIYSPPFVFVNLSCHFFIFCLSMGKEQQQVTALCTTGFLSGAVSLTNVVSWCAC